MWHATFCRRSGSRDRRDIDGTLTHPPEQARARKRNRRSATLGVSDYGTPLVVVLWFWVRARGREIRLCWFLASRRRQGPGKHRITACGAALSPARQPSRRRVDYGRPGTANDEKNLDTGTRKNWTQKCVYTRVEPGLACRNEITLDEAITCRTRPTQV